MTEVNKSEPSLSEINEQVIRQILLSGVLSERIRALEISNTQLKKYIENNRCKWGDHDEVTITSGTYTQGYRNCKWCRSTCNRCHKIVTEELLTS